MTGFTLNGNLRNLPNRFFAAAAERLESVAHDGVFRWYSVPDDFSVAIPAYGTLYQQISMLPDALVWGMSFAAIDGSASDYWLQISNGDTQQRWFSSQAKATVFASNNATKLRPVLLAQPQRLVNGLLNVELHNGGSVAQRCQLLFWVSERGANIR